MLKQKAKVLLVKHPCEIPSPEHPDPQGTCSVVEPFPPKRRGGSSSHRLWRSRNFFLFETLLLEKKKKKKVFERQPKLPFHPMAPEAGMEER